MLREFKYFIEDADEEKEENNILFLWTFMTLLGNNFNYFFVFEREIRIDREPFK